MPRTDYDEVWENQDGEMVLVSRVERVVEDEAPDPEARIKGLEAAIASLTGRVTEVERRTPR